MDDIDATLVDQEMGEILDFLSWLPGIVRSPVDGEDL
jgi:hypothetical protein